MNASLTEAKSELETKNSTLESLEQSKKEAEQQLAALTDSLEKLKSERDADVATLESVRAEVCFQAQATNIC